VSEIYPLIPDRTTEQLLDIVETKEQWRPEVVELAQKELIKRGVTEKTQETTKTIREKFQKRIATTKARASYTAFEKVLIFFFGAILILVLQDLSLLFGDDGYKTKNRQGRFYLLSGFFFWLLVYFII
jgi:hypothetical protein